MKKRLSLLMVLMMIVSLLPMSAFAASTAYPGSVQNVDVDKTFTMNVTFELNAFTDLTPGKEVRFDLDNAEFTGTTAITVDGVSVTNATNSMFYWTSTSKAYAAPNKVTVNVKATDVEVTGEGDVKLTVTDDNSGIGSQTVVVAKGVSESKADLAVTVKDAEKAISFDGGKLSQFEIKNFENIKAGGKFAISLDDDNLNLVGGTLFVDGIKVTTPDFNNIVVTNATKSVVVVDPVVSVGRKAVEGPVRILAEAIDSNGKVYMSEKATIGKIVDYAVTMTVVQKGKKEIPNVWGGEEATVTVTLKGPKGSILNRAIDFTVEGSDVKYSTATLTKGGGSLTGTKDGDFFKDAEFSTTALAGDQEEVKFDIVISTDSDKDGTATITAAQRGWEVKADLAKVTPKFTAKAEVTPVKKGEAKDTSVVTITEAKAGLLSKGEKLSVKFDTRRDYTQFSTKDIKVEATNGMKFDLDNIKWGQKEVTSGKFENDFTEIVIPITKASFGEAAVITISGMKVLVDGSTTDDIVKLQARLDGKKTANIDYIKVVKEYDLESILSVFTIGQTAYTVNGETKAAHSAPYIKAGRTMLPIRAVAESLGLEVQWNSATRTASFTDANKVAAVTIGSKVLYVNGTPMPLTVPAELVNDTTFVELRSLATSFGVQIDWDAAAKTATVSK